MNETTNQTSSGWAAARWPRPFYEGWPRAVQPAAQALWHWHTHLAEPRVPALDGADRTAFFEDQVRRAGAGKPVSIVPPEVWAAAYEACAAHRLPRELLARQIRGAARYEPPLRLETAEDLNAFMQDWVAPHARLLAYLAGATLRSQQRHADELARGFFLTRVLLTLPADLQTDRVFIPLADLEQAGVSLDALREGRLDERVRKLLWKQVIRARDAFAQGRPLVHDLPWRLRGPFKRAWIGGLEVLHEIERRRYDVWSAPITLSLFQQAQVRLQALAGRTTFKARR